MANTYKKVYLHLVFAVKHRQALLHKDWRGRVFGYLFEAINKRGTMPTQLGGIMIMFIFSLIIKKESSLMKL